MDKTEACMESLTAIRDMCQAAGVNLVVVTAPVYIEYFSDFDQAEVEQFYTALAEVTPFWDFSVSSVSYEPRYFYDETHFRNDVGRMALARMFGDEEVYVPEDFGVYVTQDNVAEQLASYWAGNPLTEAEYTANVPILMYHHLAETGDDSMRISVDLFEEQIRALWEAGYTAISFEELQAYVMEGAPLPDKPVCITFDDGYLSNYELAFPILQQYNMKATIFAIGVSVGKEQYKDTDYEMTPHFSWEQAREMVDSGLISIQSHTWDMHQWAPFEDGDSPRENMLRMEGEGETEYIQVLTQDCETVAEQFSAHLGYVPTVLAYPGGYYDTLSQAVLNRNGYAVTLSTRHGSNVVIQGLPQSLYAMKRFTMNDAVTVETLLDWVSAARGS
jgi:peptidoglycan/xylan/chitin deacetylase (PgdA/CDA1 family)